MDTSRADSCIRNLLFTLILLTFFIFPSEGSFPCHGAQTNDFCRNGQMLSDASWVQLSVAFFFEFAPLLLGIAFASFALYKHWTIRIPGSG